ncbi:putative NACHT and WD domain protein [Rosellinia necatrix]|uniref:Putative NACHT and WD domain protein n=1 Tax=Rosellinia necatrix TaxID=77044 RepID=A0A1S8A6D9_ROSNE|nr:putative NACHT and WD domain protein [Rosellinia necatrix]
MPWYLSLPILIPQNEGTTEDPSVEDISDPVSRADAFKDGIVNLYKAILHVGILSACFGLEDSPRSLDSMDLDDPTYRPSQHCPQYEDIIRLEQVLAVSLGGLRVEDQLHHLLEVAHPQEDDTSPTSELIKKLNVAHQPISNNWDFLRNTSQWSMEIAKEIDLTGGGGNQVVWVTGDVTSKTIFLQSLVQRLLGLDALSSSAPKVNVAYLFHDNELKSRRGNSTSIVRNLIWQVLHSQHLLSRHLEDKISAIKRDDFDDPNDFYALSTLLCALLRDDELNMTYFILDGLEQLCGNPSDGIRDPYEDKWGLADMVRLIVTTSRLSNRVRWLVSTDNPDTVMGIASQLDVRLDRGTSTLPITELSGNIPEEGEGGVPPVAEIENMAVNKAGEDQDPQFIQTSIKVSLVDNSIRRAANRYTELKVHELARKADYGGDLRRQVTEKLQTCSEGNLLWVNLACDIIEAKGVPWNAPRLLESLERDVFDLYERMRAALRDFGEDDEKFCNDILTTAAVAFRPLSLAELADLVKLPAKVNLKVIVGKMCFTFLEITEGKVCFKHAAAYEYLRKHMKEADVLSQAHADMVKRCLDTALNDLSYRNDEGRSDDGKPKPANYAAVHWIRHLSAIEISQIPNVMEYVNKFLTDHFLEWLGILSSHRLLGQAQTHLQILDASWAKKAGDVRLPFAGNHIRVANIV